MHLAREMPSFLSSDNSPVYSQSSSILRLEPSLEYGLSDAKANGHILHPSHPHPATNDTFDESSTHSTQTSDISSDPQRPPAHLNGASSPDRPSMTDLPDQPRGSGPQDSHLAKSLPNGFPHQKISLPERPRHSPPPPPAAPTDSTKTATRDAANLAPPSSEDGPASRNSTSSAAAGSIQQSPVELYMQPVNRGDVRTVDGSSPSPAPSPNPSASLPANLSLSASDDDSSPPPAHSYPHRFSSSASQNPAAGSAAAAASASSTTLHAPPSGHALKQRHTLEVPRIAPGRGSRDSADTALASGRFSPTNAATSASAAVPRKTSLSLARRNTRSLHSEVPRDEILPDEDALRWAEAYRQKRASKRKRVEREDDDRVLVGTKVDESHANWVTAYNMLTGIRVSVSRTNAKLDRPLTDADFDAKQKSTFDIAGNELVPSAKYDFKFKDYAPWVFRRLRSLFRLDPADYLMSLTGKYILSELGSPGKSGSFFYFSRDYKYIIKTIHHSEHKFLRKILKDYYQHVSDNPNTLLSQFYGLHRVKIPYGKKIHFVIMNNLFPPHRDIHQTFDLKGSTIGRDFREDGLGKNPRATLKDLNWLRRQRNLELGLEKKRLFLQQLHKDVRLLQRLQIMDYSLLIGIHDLERGNDENLRDKTLQVFNPGGDAAAAAGQEFDPSSVLMRTPSKLENQRKARELRQMLKSERPVPMGQSSSRMPDELAQSHNRPGFVFNQDDGGLRATHEDNSPSDEIYYLGVIDCLTHYGIIKKIEHFWKGLSNDRSQISALPPDEYGERFINFISGVTKSNEEAIREAQERDLAHQAAAAESDERARQEAAAAEAAERGDAGRRSTGSFGPSTNHPARSSSLLSASHNRPSGPDATVHRAEHVAGMTEAQGAREDQVPNRTLKTETAAAGAGATTPPSGSSPPNGPSHERRESTLTASQPAILPVVEEAAEGISTAAQSRNSHVSSLGTESDGRPLTPAKDGDGGRAGFGNPILGGAHRMMMSRPPGVGSANNSANGDRAAPPPTPPKTAYSTQGTAATTAPHGKPESADSGYGVSTNSFPGHTGNKGSLGSQRSFTNVRAQMSRESLDKALPPLPRGNPRRPAF